MIRFCIFYRFSGLTVALPVGAFVLGFLIAPPAWAQVTKTTTYTYDEDNLLPLTITETGTNMPTRVTAYTYAHDVLQYADMKARNMLVQVAREDVYELNGGAKTYHASTVTTWRDFSGSVRWRPYRQYAWQAAGPSSSRPSFSSWLPSQTPSAAWVRMVEVYAYHNVNARPTEITDTHGARTKLYYGDNSNPLSNTATGFRHAHLTGIRRMKGSADSADDLIHTAKYSLGRSSPIEITDASGSTTSFTYDGLGRLTTVRNNAGAKVASYAYRIAGADIGTEPNYVQTRLFGQNDNSYVESTQFIDGLGRPIQTIERGHTGKEIVAALQYDAQGREWRRWKPYERSRTGNATRPAYATNDASEAQHYYNTTAGNSRPFIETLYHADPRGRIRVVQPEGVSSESQSVRYSYGVSSLNGKMHTYTQITDEEGRRTRSYSDAMGREVRSIQDYGGIAATTGYEYDVLDRITFTMPPTFYHPRTGDDSSQNTHRTSYTYDTRGNLRNTTSPDAGTVRHRYDKAGRLRFSQDARQHAGNEAAFTRYDTFSRPVRSGVASVSNFDALDPESITNTFEHTPTNWLSVWHYDTGIAVDQFPWDRVPTSAYSGFYQTNIKGRLSARAYKSDGVWQVELYRYDSEGRITAKRILTEDLPTRQTNYTYVYDRQGRLLERTNQVGSFNAWNYYDYDSYGRLEKIFMKTTYPGKPASPEVTYTYNAAGQKTGERYRGNGLLPFKYTIRGQLYDIGSPRNYAYPIPFSARYIYTPAGNVQYAEFYQRDSPHFFRGYRYAHTYDNLNRLKDAQFAEWAGGSAFYHSG